MSSVISYLHEFSPIGQFPTFCLLVCMSVCLSVFLSYLVVVIHTHLFFTCALYHVLHVLYSTFIPQSAKLFLKSSELGLPQPLIRRRVCPPPPPPDSGGRGTLSGERGVGSKFRQFRRGNFHCGTLYIWIPSFR
jgi:hypothetical protein